MIDAGDNDDEKKADGEFRVIMITMFRMLMMARMVMVKMMKKPEEDGWSDPFDKECVSRLAG